MKRSPCAAGNAPFIISKPQFLDADEKLVANVDGLKPNRKDHDIFLHLEMVREGVGGGRKGIFALCSFVIR